MLLDKIINIGFLIFVCINTAFAQEKYKIYDPYGKNLGSIYDNRIYDRYGKYLGKVENKKYFDKFGKKKYNHFKKSLKPINDKKKK